VKLRVASRIQRALDSGRPVVALESTVITHGLPRPENLQLAADLEAEVRQAGAEPATIGVLGGELVIGLEADELHALEKVDEPTAYKIANLRPQDRDELRALYAQERYSLSGDELDEILNVVDQYA
jgi:pseudouridine-5'-phosphate glycosidase